MARKEILNLIGKSINELKKEKKLSGFTMPEIQMERPEEKVHGDYATNAAMVVAKIVKKEPVEVGENLKSQISKLKTNLFEKIEVAKPGFINFFLSKEYLQKQVKEILKQGEKFGKLGIGKGQKVQVEFISANPTGPLHIGNGRGAFFGDTLANVLEKAGYKVTREYYINDAKNSAQIKELGKTALGEGTMYLNEYLETKINLIEILMKASKRKIQDFKDEGEAGYLLAQEVQRDNKDFIEEKLKIKFDNWVSEKDLYQKSKVDKIYNWLKNKNLIYKKEDAEWLKTSDYGEKKDWVIKRSEAEGGEFTYLLSDIAYHKDKFERGFQKIINIWGADHQGHVSKIKAAAKILNYKGELDILISQIVRLKSGLKISKRKGEIITLEDLIDEVGLDVARFLYLTKSLNTQMEFDLELAKEQSEKNPVYYIQYAHARICSILKKISNWNPSKTRKGGGRVGVRFSIFNFNLLDHQSELGLIKQLIRFPEIVEDAAKDYQIQRIPQYAIDLATVFHQFYRDCKVLTDYNPPTARGAQTKVWEGGGRVGVPSSAGPSARPLREARLGLILATKIVLENTLNLMGISAPEKM